MGRGGFILCATDEAEARFEIDLIEGDSFGVHVQGRSTRVRGSKPRALRAPEREELIAQLQAWLDSTGRTRWSIASKSRR